MPRPRRCRRVWFEPDITYFKPSGIAKSELDESILRIDEFEAVRLKDMEGMDQGDAARKMDISQPTFHRLLLNARKKIADAIVNGKAIRIEGGNYRTEESIYHDASKEHDMPFPQRRQISRQGMKRIMNRKAGSMGRRSRRFAAQAGERCICPECGYILEHEAGKPCSETICPECNSRMMRR